MRDIETLVIAFADFAWGPWLLVLLLGGGIFFLIYSRFLPFRYLRHALDIICGKQGIRLTQVRATYWGHPTSQERGRCRRSVVGAQ